MASVESSMREMVGDEEKGSSAIVHDRGGLGLAKDSQSALQIGAAVAAITGFEIELYIIISGGDVSEDFPGALCQRRASEVCVNDNASAVDDRLNSARSKLLNCAANKIDNRARLGNFATPANLRQLAADKIDNQWSGQVDLT